MKFEILKRTAVKQKPSYQRTPEQQRSYKKRVWKREITGTLMASLPFIGFLIFTLYPMLISLYVSFTDLHSYDVNMAVFNGIQNYIKVFKDPLLYKAIGNTMLYVLSVPLSLALAIFLANLLTKDIPAKKVLRVIYFLPQVCSTVGVTLMWQWIFQEDGVINTYLSMANISKILFMTDENWYMVAIIMISLWKHGTNIVVLQASFVNVDKTVVEAAQVDGANSITLFWKITLPMITPTVYYLLTMNLISSLQEQTLFLVLTNNGTGPNYRGLSLCYYIYKMVSTDWLISKGMGMSCALSWITAIFILAVTKINSAISKYWVHYD